jgi:exo-beta-1,3-glucanase (GH17 family)
LKNTSLTSSFVKLIVRFIELSSNSLSSSPSSLSSSSSSTSSSSSSSSSPSSSLSSTSSDPTHKHTNLQAYKCRERRTERTYLSYLKRTREYKDCTKTFLKNVPEERAPEKTVLALVQESTGYLRCRQKEKNTSARSPK